MSGSLTGLDSGSEFVSLGGGKGALGGTRFADPAYPSTQQRAAESLPQ